MFATFSDGPESRCLTFRAKESENKFEAQLQLSLLSRIYLSNGVGTSAELLSALSSVFFIGKTGVQNFLLHALPRSFLIASPDRMDKRTA